METGNIKRFAQNARRQLISQVNAKLTLVLADGSLARRENPTAVQALERDITEHGKANIVERVAYTWSNRFSALRFMDVNHYTSIGIVSPAPGQTQPEILAEAKTGHIDGEIPNKIKQEVMDLLTGNKISKNPQQRAFKLLMVAYCNIWSEAMPFLFERIQDYTELLLPDDLLSDQSVLMQMQSVLTEEVCQDVEVIGWLYQFYISEKKDEVFDGLKQNKKVTPENIPAATQLFTPNWIVRYLVENSLGRLWMLNHPHAKLIDEMEYYIKPEQPEKDFLKISSPEEIRICDPACGSGHMLVYAFDLLYKIYEEEGYSETQIPELILTKNLFGIEIDKRAGELAAFALTMKARSKQRRFFKKQIQPNICVLENVKFESGEFKAYMDYIGSDLFTLQLQNTLHQFEEADNFGSLIRPDLTDVEPMVQFLNAKNVGADLFLNRTHNKVLKVLEQAEYLRSKYHVVVANPPYMGGGNMNGRLSSWVKENYPDSKSDLFAVFIERGMNLTIRYGYNAMVTMQSWMFLSSFDKLRKTIIDKTKIICMAHMANMVMGIAFGTAATVQQINANDQSVGHYCFIDYENIDKSNKPYEFPPQNERNDIALQRNGIDRFYRASAADFEKIPGSPIAYWVSEKIRLVFRNGKRIECLAEPRQGMATSDNERFVRFYFEISENKAKLNCKTRAEAKESSAKWFPYSKGGENRRWYP
ncbi:MAG: BREX-1 system adenine-specific DNA-methyltransferase PglX [Bacillota bacterium]|nr:BREX-1 system adenine-specific DNA-methyltransferase PglX [Bacillota bacterium]